MGASFFYNIAAEAKCHNVLSPYCLTIMNTLLYGIFFGYQSILYVIKLVLSHLEPKYPSFLFLWLVRY